MNLRYLITGHLMPCRIAAIKLVLTLLYFCWIPLSVAGQVRDFPGKPNIIFIMADDLGYGDLGCYGQTKILTPNIDRLAAEGMRFTQAYAGATVCAPSRCSLMTGFHNGHNRIRDNLPHGTYLRPDDFTVAELLKTAGYRTGGVGKWGLGVPGTWGLPNQQGFDYWYGHYAQDQAHFYYPDFLWENDRLVLLQDMVIVNEVGKLAGNRGGENAFYTHDFFTEKALAYVEQHRDHPFFLYLSYTIPHFSDYPKESPDHYIVPSDEPYSDLDWPQQARNYAAMITRLDGDVGKIVKLVEELDMEKSTMIVFTSDNGPYQGVPTPVEFFDSNGPLRGGKRDNYEGGIRVPFIARWKGRIPEGATNDKVIAFWDMLPTFADIIDYPDPLETDGLSILPDLMGNAGQQHEYLYWDYGHVRETYSQALRYGDYKILSFVRGDDVRYELYDLAADIGESDDLAAQNPGLLRTMKGMLHDAYAYTDNYPRVIQH